MPQSLSTLPSCEVIVLTTLPVEYTALLSHLHNPQEFKHPSGTFYHWGRFAGRYRAWNVALVNPGSDATVVALEVEKALTTFHPQMILFVDTAIAAGQMSYGDVFIATTLQAHQPGEIVREDEPLQEIWQANELLADHARTEAQYNDWLVRLSGPSPRPEPGICSGPLALNEKVLLTARTNVYKLSKPLPELPQAIDRCGQSLAQSLSVTRSIPSLVIRGIFDIFQKRIEREQKDLSELAARHAAAFTFHLLATFQGLPLTVEERAQVSIEEENQRLRHRLYDLQDDYERWSGVFRRLRQRRSVEGNTAVLPQLEKEIKVAQGECSMILQQIQLLEQQIVDNRR